MENIILNLDLAREIELAEAEAAVGCAQMMTALQSDSVGAVEAIAGGYACTAGQATR